MRTYEIIVAISTLLLASNCNDDEEYSGTVYLETQAMPMILVSRESEQLMVI
jgi:hypothetical protein